jgi:hypothetical protein
MGYELSLLMGATGLVLAVALVQVVVLVRLTRTAADITRMHDRLTRMVAALDLLTDTAETGFRQFAEHLDQRAASASADAAPARRPEASARRMAASQVQTVSAPAAASTPVRATRKGAKKPAAAATAVATSAHARPTPVASTPDQAAAAPASMLMVATRKAARTNPASTRRTSATVSAFREAN